jgi:hypothetical protein
LKTKFLELLQLKWFLSYSTQQQQQQEQQQQF